DFASTETHRRDVAADHKAAVLSQNALRTQQSAPTAHTQLPTPRDRASRARDPGAALQAAKTLPIFRAPSPALLSRCRTQTVPRALLRCWAWRRVACTTRELAYKPC